MVHPGYPNGAGNGMLVKDYRGKNAEQEIWKFDGALVTKILDVLKQAAIEEGQWSEKRDQEAGTIAGHGQCGVRQAHTAPANSVTVCAPFPEQLQF